MHRVGAAFEGQLLSFSRRENRAPEYLALNPEDKVPVLPRPWPSNGRSSLTTDLPVRVHSEAKAVLLASRNEIRLAVVRPKNGLFAFGENYPSAPHARAGNRSSQVNCEATRQGRLRLSCMYKMNARKAWGTWWRLG
jgi:hypothetical protein